MFLATQDVSRMDASPRLLDLLRQVPDLRRAEGKRPPLPVVLSLLALAVALSIPIFERRARLLGTEGATCTVNAMA